MPNKTNKIEGKQITLRQMQTRTYFDKMPIREKIDKMPIIFDKMSLGTEKIFGTE